MTRVRASVSGSSGCRPAADGTLAVPLGREGDLGPTG